MYSGCAAPPGGLAVRQQKYQDSNPVVRFVIRRFFGRLRSLVQELQPQSLLDAGCGEGELFRRAIIGPEVTPVCLDLKTDSLLDLRAEVNPVRLVCGSVQALPFPAGSFDVAVCLEVLEHLEEPAVAVRELARVTRRAILLSVPYEPYFRIGNLLRGKHLRHWGNFPEHVQHWNRRTLGKLLSSVLSEIRLIEACPWILACCRPDYR